MAPVKLYATREEKNAARARRDRERREANPEAVRERERNRKRASRAKKRKNRPDNVSKPAPKQATIACGVTQAKPRQFVGPAVIVSAKATPRPKPMTANQLAEAARMRRIIVREYYTEPDPIKRAFLVQTNSDIPLVFVTI